MRASFLSALCLLFVGSVESSACLLGMVPKEICDQADAEERFKEELLKVMPPDQSPHKLAEREERAREGAKHQAAWIAYCKPTERIDGNGVT